MFPLERARRPYPTGFCKIISSFSSIRISVFLKVTPISFSFSFSFSFSGVKNFGSNKSSLAVGDELESSISIPSELLEKPESESLYFL